MYSIYLYHTWWRICWVFLFAPDQNYFLLKQSHSSQVLWSKGFKKQGRGERGVAWSNFSLIHCKVHTVHVFAGWTDPQWTALLLWLMACRVLSVVLFSLFLGLDLKNSSYINVNLGSLVLQHSHCLPQRRKTNSGSSLVLPPAIKYILKRMCVFPGAIPACGSMLVHPSCCIWLDWDTSPRQSTPLRQSERLRHQMKNYTCASGYKAKPSIWRNQQVLYK